MTQTGKSGNLNVASYSMTATTERFIKFCLVGAGGTFVYYALLLIFVEWLALPVLVSTSVAFLIVVMQQYLLHYIWTFQSTKRHIVAMPAYALMTIVGFLINLLVMYVGVEIIDEYYLFVQIAAIATVLLWNLIVSNLVIFRDQV